MEYRGLVFQGFGLYLLFLGIVSWFFTQHFAHQLGHHPELGDPWIQHPAQAGRYLLLMAAGSCVSAIAVVFLRSVRRAVVPLACISFVSGALAVGPLYTPVHILLWIWRYRSSGDLELLLAAPRIGLMVAAGGSTVFLFTYLTTQSSRFREKPDTHGSAHWASEQEVREAGLLDNKRGLLLGIWSDRGRPRYLRHDGPEHVFVFAPTRTGKGVGLVLPNLLTWPHSVLVHDIKGENWALSAGWRRRALGSVCIRFDPTDAEGTSARYNPLSEIRLGPHEVRDAQNVADILVDPNGDRSRDHWDRTAHALLVGVTLHILYAEADKTLRGCANFLTNPARSVEDTLEAMILTEHDPEGRMGWVDSPTGAPTTIHPVVSASARALLDKSPNERSGVISTALTFLDLFRDPILAANTETSDFRLEALMQSERPVSLYLTVPSSDLARTRPLVRMLLNQALRRLTEKMIFENGRQVPHYRQPLLLMLDEFPALGRLAFFQESLAYLAGYGIRAFLVTQDLSQLYGVYGRQEAITGNCHIRIAFAPNKPETADLLSRMAGDMTVHMEQRSYRGDRFDLVLNKQYVSQQQVQRRLLTPDEAMRLPDDEALIFVAGHPPMRTSKIQYFSDDELFRRSIE
jgi:type IV secretion system protein VirD4